MEKLIFLNDLILRIPLLSNGQFDLSNLSKLLSNNYLKNAISLSSPVFYDRIIKKLKFSESFSIREQTTLFKYFNRLCYRPTPFGSFASISFIEWRSNSVIDAGPTTNVTLKTYPDQRLVIKLAENIFSSFILRSRYHINRTLYKIKGSYRFVETNTDNEQYVFTLHKIDHNQLTNALIKFCGNESNKGDDLVKFFKDLLNCEMEKAIQLLEMFVSSKILINSDGPYIAGPDYFTFSLVDANLLPKPKALKAQFSFQAPVGFLDAFMLDSDVKNMVQEAGVDISNSLHYVIAERKIHGGLSPEYQTQIRDGINCLKSLSISGQPKSLDQFIIDFKLRFENQKVPLLEVLDPQFGIGYDNSNTHKTKSPLVNNVRFSNGSPLVKNIEWTNVHKILLQKLTELSGKHTIKIHDSDLENLQQGGPLLPSTMAVMFRITDEGLFIENAGGASASGLLGRFTLANEDILNTAKHLANHEMQTNPGVVFAEILQLSDSKADNINRRKAIYAYDIPINTNSSLSETNQIRLTDLYVQIVNNEIILESKILKKRIIPRLSSAYNYQRNDLTVFRFLCDLQHHQVKSNLHLALHLIFPGLCFYPRIEYNNIILYPARWHFNLVKQSIAPIISLDSFRNWKSLFKIPDNILLTENDQQLQFNLNKEVEIRFFLNCIKGLNEFTLQEQFSYTRKNPVTGTGGYFNHQFMAFLSHTNVVYKPTFTVKVSSQTKVQRTFPPGSRWAYFKIFTHNAVADELLYNVLWPVIKKLRKNNIHSWFYVRYNEGGNHLRIRFNVSENDNGIALNTLSRILGSQLAKRKIYDFHVATYSRELERYSPELITYVEDFFCVSSELITAYLKNMNRISDNNLFLLGIASIDNLLNSFFSDIETQKLFCKKIADSFFEEFSGDKSLKIDLDKKCKELLLPIKEVLSNKNFYKQNRLNQYAQRYYEQAAFLANKTQFWNARRRDKFLSDLIHMHINRLFDDMQRQQELILYYCLYKHKRMVLARSR